MNAFGEIEEFGNARLNSNLLTSRVILFLLPHLRAEPTDLSKINEITKVTVGIVHLLMTLVLAIAGGLIAVLLRRIRAGESRQGHSPLLRASSWSVASRLRLASARPASRFFPPGALRWRGLGGFRRAPGTPVI